MNEGVIAAAVSLIALCIAIFRSIAGPVTNWTHDTLASLGTFVGGTLGVLGLLAALLQFVEASRSQRKSLQNALEDRHRSDLRSSIDRKILQLDRLLDDATYLKIGNDFFSLRTLIGTAIAYLPTHQIPDYAELQSEVTQNPGGVHLASKVLWMERCAQVTLTLNQLRALCREYDKLTKSNVMSEEVRTTYYFTLGVLKAKNYPIHDW